jgi:hypothetical protein
MIDGKPKGKWERLVKSVCFAIGSVVLLSLI